MFLLIVDAHSKWMDIHITHTSTSQITVDKLRQTFATFGLLRMIVTDNGPSFTSKEFQSFMTENGIIHKKSSPYHPATNGLAERAVQTFKCGIKTLSGPLETRLVISIPVQISHNTTLQYWCITHRTNFWSNFTISS